MTDSCSATIWHGPGHQSRARCRRHDQHDVHEAVYGSNNQFAQWVGDRTCSDTFDEPPSFDDEVAPAPPPAKPIPPLSLTQLDQLRWYAVEMEREGSYYGDRKNFDKRHAAIMVWLDAQIEAKGEKR